MEEETRSVLTIGLWFLSALVLGTVFISAGMIGELSLWHVGFAIVLLTIAVCGTAVLFRLPSSESLLAKAKRQRIDSMLRDMSDEELVELKKRLSDGNYNEESLLEYVSDDGELVFRD